MRVVTEPNAMAALIDEVGRVSRIGVDVEGNGLHAYRAELCVVQLAWKDAAGNDQVAIVDPFAVDVDELAPILASSGPVKVLHDLTFDARLLLESGVRLGNVHDTSVMASLLGEPKSGLASLVDAHFGTKLSKALQDHDWAERPFTDRQLHYLTQDVHFLFALDDLFGEQVRERGIATEVEVECAHKLRTAMAPPRDQRAPHERIKGYRSLSPSKRAVLAALCETREQIAETADVPPFRIIASGLLLEMARRLPKDERTVSRMCRNKRAARHTDAWLRAIAEGQKRPPINNAPAPPGSAVPAAEQARRKTLKKKLTAWRKAEAERREVTLQVVIPGHCMSDVAAALAGHPNDAPTLLEALSAVEGLGDCRIDRYLGAWSELAAG